MKIHEMLTLVHSGIDFSSAADQGIDNNTDASGYPDGLSAFFVSDGTWPFSYGNVITMNMTGVRFSQIFITKNNTAVYFRGLSGNGPALEPWMIVYDNGWTAFTLKNSWTNYGSVFPPAAYRKDADNIVRLKGLVRNGTSLEITDLPIGYRPVYRHYITVVSNNSFAGVAIYPDGRVNALSGYSTSWIAFDGVTFHTD